MLVFGGLIILLSEMKTGHFLKSVILTGLQGIAAIYAVNIVGSFFGVNLAVNTFSLSVGIVGGTPGVILLLLLDIIFRKV